MIGIKLDSRKDIFFDRARVLRAVDKATRRVLSRFGAFVRTTARHSIRKRKRSAPPGQPPSSHTGLLRRFIFFGYDRDQKSVIIGPVKLSHKRGATPAVLEHGGWVKSKTDGKSNAGGFRAARPFMQPAFDQEQSKLPAMWADSIH